MKSWFSIRNLSADTAEIDIFDEIGLWGVTAKQFVEQLRAAGKFANITVNLDSPGGDCNDGFTIYDAIKACGASVTVNITGLAASMASVIMLAADKGKIRIAENGRVMIHRVTGGANGNSDDLAAATQLVRQFEDRIVALYADRTGQSEADIRELMKAQLGTWFFGQEAVDAGFADAIISGAKARAFKSEWAALFTMLPAALFDNRDTRNGPKPAPQPQPPTPIDMTLRASLIAALALTDLPSAPLTDEQIFNSFSLALTAERKTHTDATAKAKSDIDALNLTITGLRQNVTDAQAAEKAAKDSAGTLAAQLKAALNLSDAQVTAFATDKAVVTNAIELLATNKAIALAASQGTQPVLKDWDEKTGEKTMTVADFNQLTHAARNEFIRAGGKLTD